MHGKEQKMEKPFAVLEKIVHEANATEDDDDEDMAHSQSNSSQLNITANERTVLDSTIAIQHKTTVETEYAVRAIVKKKIIFKSRPKPIIANVSKTH